MCGLHLSHLAFAQFERVRTALSASTATAAKPNASQANHVSSPLPVSASVSAASAASAPSVSAVEAVLSESAPGAASEGCVNDAVANPPSIDDGSDDDIDSDALSDHNEDDGPEFPELVDEIETAIEALGGAVFPKLNWSAPKVGNLRFIPHLPIFSVLF
jgi:hypothetical protein